MSPNKHFKHTMSTNAMSIKTEFEAKLFCHLGEMIWQHQQVIQEGQWPMCGTTQDYLNIIVSDFYSLISCFTL